jgi:hypothetical protein
VRIGTALRLFALRLPANENVSPAATRGATRASRRSPTVRPPSVDRCVPAGPRGSRRLLPSARLACGTAGGVLPGQGQGGAGASYTDTVNAKHGMLGSALPPLDTGVGRGSGKGRPQLFWGWPVWG